MKIEAIEVQKVTGAPALWQEIVDASRNGWIWHTWTFHEFNLCAGKQFEATDLSFFIYQDGQAVGVVPLMVQNVTLGAYTGREATGYSGPLSWPCFRKDLDPERIKELETLKACLDYVREIAKKGLSIQRYKGLGEMNPEQLWETTMNPETRTLLKVTMEDAVEANEMFTVLMGDAVEPRRAFIEKHALEVRNLDI